MMVVMVMLSMAVMVMMAIVVVVSINGADNDGFILRVLARSPFEDSAGLGAASRASSSGRGARMSAMRADGTAGSAGAAAAEPADPRCQQSGLIRDGQVLTPEAVLMALGANQQRELYELLAEKLLCDHDATFGAVAAEPPVAAAQSGTPAWPAEKLRSLVERSSPALLQVLGVVSQCLANGRRAEAAQLLTKATDCIEKLKGTVVQATGAPPKAAAAPPIQARSAELPPPPEAEVRQPPPEEPRHDDGDNPFDVDWTTGSGLSGKKEVSLSSSSTSSSSARRKRGRPAKPKAQEKDHGAQSAGPRGRSPEATCDQEKQGAGAKACSVSSSSSPRGRDGVVPIASRGAGGVDVRPGAGARGPSRTKALTRMVTDARDGIQEGETQARVNLKFASMVIGNVSMERPSRSSGVSTPITVEAAIEMINTRADHVFFFSWEPVVPISVEQKTKFLQMVVGKCKNHRCSLVKDGVGAIFYDNERVTGVKELDTPCHGNMVVSVWEVALKPGRYNAGKGDNLCISVGAVFSRTNTRQLAPKWPEPFEKMLKHAVVNHKVRLLTGVFDCNVAALGSLLRSSGASGTAPIALPFRREKGADGTLLSEPLYVCHPHYIVAFGPAQIHECAMEDQPSLPEWYARGADACLEPKNGFQSYELPFLRKPSWDRLDRDGRRQTGTDEWPHLNNVRFKRCSTTLLCEGLHYLSVHVEHKGRRSGAGAEAKKRRRRRDTKQQQAATLRPPQQRGDRTQRPAAVLRARGSTKDGGERGDRTQRPVVALRARGSTKDGHVRDPAPAQGPRAPTSPTKRPSKAELKRRDDLAKEEERKNEERARPRSRSRHRSQQDEWHQRGWHQQQEWRQPDWQRMWAEWRHCPECWQVRWPHDFRVENEVYRVCVYCLDHGSRRTSG